MKSPQEPDYQRVAMTILLAALILVGWQYFVEWPRRQQLAQYNATQQQIKEAEVTKKATVSETKATDREYDASLSREARLALSPRIAIGSDKLHGSIALRGARFDDLTLAKYKVSQDADSSEVVLFAPNGESESYFAHAGWVAIDGKTKVPDQNTIWKASVNKLTPNTPVTLSWNNGAGVDFFMTVALDANYMFTIDQRVKNHSGSDISIAPYGYINRAHTEAKSHNAILHEGPIGVLQKALTEISYEEMRDKKSQTFEGSEGWLGVADKYWLAAMVPADKGFKATFNHYMRGEQPRYQVDYLGTTQQVASGSEDISSLRLFAGAKEISVLDAYAKGNATAGTPPIPLFDRAVDFGVLYFMTKPMFLLLNMFYALIGNFGLAIMMMTIVVKLCMFPLANKSYKSMSQMRLLQPEMLQIRERLSQDPMAMNKEMMALYKRNKVNPASGCLPLLIQMPVFFALYKVLFVTIEMRHAPFFGWLKDLSAIDSSNIFTLFSLVPWDHPSWLHLGILPILMCATMVIQQKQQPAPTDPVQARMMKIMPYAFLLFFVSFPAGLVLYWVWSNILSIIQQAYISRRYTKKNGVIKEIDNPVF
jgi:YidC/Oxa1 family membrane protein insertase